MAIIAKASGGNFIPPPPGQHAGVCVDVVDLGMIDSSFAKKKVHKIRIVWQLAENRPDGKPHQASQMYTLSLHEKAALRKDLESWRGLPFKEDELTGFDVEKLLGVTCLLNIIEVKKDGKVYGNVSAIMRLPKNWQDVPVQRDYIRVVDRKTDAEAVDAPEYDEGYSDSLDQVPF